MSLRLLALVGLITATACTQQVSPRVQVGSPTPEAAALAANYCAGSTFESIDPANPPAEWYKC